LGKWGTTRGGWGQKKLPPGARVIQRTLQREPTKKKNLIAPAALKDRNKNKHSKTLTQ